MRLGPNDRQQCGTLGARVRHAAQGHECQLCEMTVERAVLDPIVATLKARRIHLGMTQKEVANAGGIDASTVSLVESGRSSPTLVVLRAIAIALGVNVKCEVPESD